MSITEASRHHLLLALEDAIGKEAAMTLAEHLPPVGWADVATRGDLDHQSVLLKAEIDRQTTLLRSEIDQLGTELRSEMAELRTELRGEIAELRTELRTGMAGLRTEMAQLESRLIDKMNGHNRTLVVGMVALVVTNVLANIFG